MNTYIALLRGINVAGQKKIKMANLKALFEGLGFTAVTTYIQSGNVIFKSTKTTPEVLMELISKEIMKQFGFDVPVLIITPEVLATIYKNNPFAQKIENKEMEDKKMYFTLLASPPDSIATKELMATNYEVEQFSITDKVVYFYAANGYGNTKLSNNFFEKKLKSQATTRNLKTVIKVLEISNSI